MPKQSQIANLFVWLFLTTGVFAIVGSLFTWGEGWLFSQFNLSTGLIPLADLILTGPLSIITAYSLWSKKVWGIYTGLLTSGIYSFGSVLVFITVIYNGSPYPFQLILPPIFGLFIAISFFIWVIKKNASNKQQ